MVELSMPIWAFVASCILILILAYQFCVGWRKTCRLQGYEEAYKEILALKDKIYFETVTIEGPNAILTNVSCFGSDVGVKVVNKGSDKSLNDFPDSFVYNPMPLGPMKESPTKIVLDVGDEE